ncbi:C40 family peptidase [Vibrio fluvialis]|nr:C40 family peptidase [Vibrio fluvialis]
MNNKLNLGDLLYRSKGLVEHAAVYIGKNRVIHTSPENGVEVITLEEYAAGQRIKVVRTSFGNQELLEKRLHEILSTSSSYQLLTDNCEHLASYLLHGRKASPQIQAAFCGAIIGLLLGRKMDSWQLVALIVISAMAGCWLTNISRTYDAQIDDYQKIGTVALGN